MFDNIICCDWLLNVGKVGKNHEVNEICYVEWFFDFNSKAIYELFF